MGIFAGQGVSVGSLIGELCLVRRVVNRQRAVSAPHLGGVRFPQPPRCLSMPRRRHVPHMAPSSLPTRPDRIGQALRSARSTSSIEAPDDSLRLISKVVRRDNDFIVPGFGQHVALQSKILISHLFENGFPFE